MTPPYYELRDGIRFLHAEGNEYQIIWDGSRGSRSLSGSMPKRPDYELIRLGTVDGRDKQHGGERIFHLGRVP